jgi:hypothetical protein
LLGIDFEVYAKLDIGRREKSASFYQKELSGKFNCGA